MLKGDGWWRYCSLDEHSRVSFFLFYFFSLSLVAPAFPWFPLSPIFPCHPLPFAFPHSLHQFSKTLSEEPQSKLGAPHPTPFTTFLSLLSRKNPLFRPSIQLSRTPKVFANPSNSLSTLFQHKTYPPFASFTKFLSPIMLVIR